MTRSVSEVRWIWGTFIFVRWEIPVAFVAESSFHTACLLGYRFALVGLINGVLRRQIELVKYHGLEQRCVRKSHLGLGLTEIGRLFEKEPKRLVGLFISASRETIAEGASALVPGYSPLSSFLAGQGIRDVDGVAIVDVIAAVIKTIEMLVDLQQLGVKRSRVGLSPYPSKQELMVARRLYGVK